VTEREAESLEADWEIYRRLAPAAVPARAEQLAVMLALIPFGIEDSFTVVELGCGEGHLSAAIARCFELSRVVALDGSPQMRDRAAERLAPYGDRVTVAGFRLEEDDWRARLTGSDAVVSSLCLHHLDDEGKRKLFAETREHLSDRGALLIADLVEAPHRLGTRLYADTWDRAARRQSLEAAGSTELFDLFVAERWNHYLYPDPFDKPSRLFDQLRWLQEVGFEVVDCFWLHAGHAVYGGYRSGDLEAGDGVPFARALEVAERMLAG
jgi:tRNA (cmo5U34)-methyltransferase